MQRSDYIIALCWPKVHCLKHLLFYGPAPRIVTLEKEEIFIFECQKNLSVFFPLHK